MEGSDLCANCRALQQPLQFMWTNSLASSQSARSGFPSSPPTWKPISHGEYSRAEAGVYILVGKPYPSPLMRNGGCFPKWSTIFTPLRALFLFTFPLSRSVYPFIFLFKLLFPIFFLFSRFPLFHIFPQVAFIDIPVWPRGRSVFSDIWTLEQMSVSYLNVGPCCFLSIRLRTEQ